MGVKGERLKTFTKRELEWLARASAKKFNLYNQMPYIFEKSNVSFLDEIGTKLAPFWSLKDGALKEEVGSNGKRVGLSVETLEELQKIIDKNIKTLENKIIPGYKKRIKGPSKKEKYYHYIGKSEENIKMLKQLKSKLGVHN